MNQAWESLEKKANNPHLLIPHIGWRWQRFILERLQLSVPHISEIKLRERRVGLI
jgi:hypothetical protein